MKKEDVKIGMEVIMTKRYANEVDKGQTFKILRLQSVDGYTDDCFVVDHDGDNSYLAPYCNYFEPTDPNFIASKDSEVKAITNPLQARITELELENVRLKEALQQVRSATSCSNTFQIAEQALNP